MNKADNRKHRIALRLCGCWWYILTLEDPDNDYEAGYSDILDFDLAVKEASERAINRIPPNVVEVKGKYSMSYRCDVCSPKGEC